MKKRSKITITIDKKVNNVLDEYIEDNKQFNKSKLIENFVKKEIQKIEDEKNK